MYRITLEPSGSVASAPPGGALLPALLEKKLNVAMSCGGKGVCATCHVRVRVGADSLSPRTTREKRTLALVADADDTSRLACQAHVLADGVVLDLPAGMYISSADDLLSLVGERAPENILHPVRGSVLIPKGKLVTRTLLEQSRGVKADLERAKATSPTEPPSGSHPPLTVPPPTSSVTTTPSGSVAVLELPTGITETLQVRRTDVVRHTGRPPSNPDTPLPVSTLVKTPATGDTVGKCLLLDPIGSGGLGIVYRALHTSLNIPVAIKFLRSPNRSASVDRFRTEARLLARLNHPNVARVLDFEDAPGCPFVVMEYVDGFSLQDLLARSGVVAPDRVVAVARQVVDGLDAARQVGIVHRDVKPGNILLTRDGVAKLVDFGLAADLAVVDPRASGQRVDGTVAYLCPDRARDPGAGDHRADIYALGITLFQLLTGRLPFTGSTGYEVLAAHASDPLPDAPEIPPRLRSVIERMTAKRPADRFQTYPELRAALTECLARGTPAGRMGTKS